MIVDTVALPVFPAPGALWNVNCFGLDAIQGIQAGGFMFHWKDVGRQCELASCLIVLFLLRCGGGGNQTATAPAPVIAVSISPSQSSLQTGATQQFVSAVSGTTSTAVTWVATGGSVSSNGLYTAPGSAGTYQVTAISVADPSKSASAPVIVSHPTSASIIFYNSTFTPVNILINGQAQTCYPGTSVTYSGLPLISMTYYAYTSGITSSGNQVGSKMEWNYSIDLTNGNQTRNLTIASNYFFITMRNTSDSILDDLYVNYGLVNQSYDSISIPNNSLIYSIGYYKAFANSNVRIYSFNIPNKYLYWENLNLPFTENQKVDLLASISTIVFTASAPSPQIDKPGSMLLPFLPNKLLTVNLDPGAITNCSNNEQ